MTLVEDEVECKDKLNSSWRKFNIKSTGISYAIHAQDYKKPSKIGFFVALEEANGNI